MSVETAGSGGSGDTKVYTLSAGQTAVLETLTFTVTTDGTAGVHMIRLRLLSPTGNVVARLDDLNEGGPTQTNFYTYGIGLNASACTLPSGIAVTDALPWTELVPGTQIFVTPITAAGVTIAGDAISAVLLHFDRDVPAPAPAQNLPLTLLPGSVAA